MDNKRNRIPLKNRLSKHPAGRRIVSLIAMAMLAMVLSGCGNKTLFDTTYTFDRAVIQLADGTIIDTKIQSWTDYEDGEQIQIVAEDGTVYLTSSYRCDLIKTATDNE